MDRPERMSMMRNRAQAMKTLAGLVVEEVPGHLPEIQQLRMRLSQSRALVLALEIALVSLYEREVPRAERTVEPNAHLNHVEAKNLVSTALAIVQRAKDLL
jgi:hypothetical protein